jgi:hypothetical protein
MCNSDGARAHFERSRTRQHRTRKEGIIKEFRKTILDSYEKKYVYEITDRITLDVQRCAYEKSDTG